MVITMTVNRALRQAGNPPEVCDAFVDEALSGDYDNVLATCAKYAEIY